MKLYKLNDCEVTAPPSTVFAALLETESDKAFMAELVDLPAATRVEEVLRKSGEYTEQLGRQVQSAGQTPRVHVQSLRDFLLNSPNSNEVYVSNVLKSLIDAWVQTEEFILGKAFLLRMFWF